MLGRIFFNILKFILCSRHTDKVGAAIPYHKGTVYYPTAHTIEEYMEHVEKWFRKYEMTHPQTKRQIFVATDDPKVGSNTMGKN